MQPTSIILPEFIWEQLLSYIPLLDRIKIQGVCQLFRNMIKKDENYNSFMLTQLSKKIHFIEKQIEENSFSLAVLKERYESQSQLTLQNRQGVLVAQQKKIKEQINHFQQQETLTLFYRLIGDKNKFENLPELNKSAESTYLFKHIEPTDVTAPLMRGVKANEKFLCVETKIQNVLKLYFFKCQPPNVQVIIHIYQENDKPPIIKSPYLIEKGRVKNMSEYQNFKKLIQDIGQKS